MATLGMTYIALREVVRRRLSFLLTIAAAASAAAAAVLALASLQAYDRTTEGLMAKRQAVLDEGLLRYDEILREAVRKLGFNVVILPENQQLADFYADDYARETMPEAYARELINAKLMTIGQLVPCLRRKVTWPETKWSVVITAHGAPGIRSGSTDEAFAVRQVPPGAVDIGWELHRGLGLASGDTLVLMGTRLQVRECVPEKGTRDDISLWLDLAEAQRLLGLEGRISEILALECRTSWSRLQDVSAEIRQTLPAIQVIEKGTETLAAAATRGAFAAGQMRLLEDLRGMRAHQRRSLQHLAWVICLAVLILGAGTAGVLSVMNARDRREEMALWYALGVATGRLQLLLAWRAVGAGVIGGALGALTGFFSGAAPAPADVVVWWATATLVAGAAMAPGGIVAAALAARVDPAVILKNDV